MGGTDVSELKTFLQAVAEDESLEISAAFLFGSRARGNHEPDSDVDLVVVSPDFVDVPSHLRAKPFYLAWEYPPDIELKCYTPAEFDRELDSVSIARMARDEGIALTE